MRGPGKLNASLMWYYSY